MTDSEHDTASLSGHTSYFYYSTVSAIVYLHQLQQCWLGWMIWCSQTNLVLGWTEQSSRAQEKFCPQNYYALHMMKMKVVSTFSVIYEGTRILCKTLSYCWKIIYVTTIAPFTPISLLIPITFLSPLSVFFCECLLRPNFCSMYIKSK